MNAQDFLEALQAWSDQLIRASWEGGLALLVAWILCRSWTRLPPSAKCWIWRLAYLKLLIAFIWPAPIELALLYPDRAQVSPPEARRFSSDWVPLPAEAGSSSGPDVPLEQAGAPVVERAPGNGSRLLLFGFALWACGVAWKLARLGGQWRSARRITRSGRTLENHPLGAVLDEVCRDFGLRRRPGLLAQEKIETPMLIGPARPVIVVPESFLEEYPLPKLRLILAHELAHVRRRDLLWGWLPLLADVFFFFHPLVWAARREWCFAQETACDALAVRLTEAPVAVYGMLLLEVIAQTAGGRGRPFAAGIIETKRTLKRRLEAMKWIGTHRSGARSVIVAGLILGIGAVGILPWKLVAQKDPAQPPERRPAEVASSSRSNAEELLQQEIALVEQQIQEVDRRLKAGAAELHERIGYQRELSRLKRQLAARSGGAAAQAEFIREEIGLLEQLLREDKERVAVGALPPIALVGWEREILRLKRELAELGMPGDPKEPSPTSEGTAETSARAPFAAAGQDDGGARRSSTKPEVRVLHLSPPRAGLVAKVFVKSGDKVEPGQPLVQMDDQDAMIVVEKAQAHLQIAEAALRIQELELNRAVIERRRLEGLKERDLVSETSLAGSDPGIAEARMEQARAELILARQEVKQAQLDRERLLLRAPKGGTVLDVLAHEGERVTGAPGEWLVLLEVPVRSPEGAKP